jgi:hypothetical protein
MFCRGRQVLGYGDLADLASVKWNQPNADTVCVSPRDFVDVKRWIA